MSQRNYIDNAPTAKLTVAATPSDAQVTVNSLSGFPSATPYTATLDLGTTSAEVVLVTNVTGLTLDVTRNYDGEGAFTHPIGATFDHTAVAKDYTEANNHVNGVGTIHGVTGAVVGTTDTQTLSNKTLASPKFTGHTPFGLVATVGPTTVTATVGSFAAVGSPFTVSLSTGDTLRFDIRIQNTTATAVNIAPYIAVSYPGGAGGLLVPDSDLPLCLPGTTAAGAAIGYSIISTFGLYTAPATAVYTFTPQVSNGATSGSAAVRVTVLTTGI